MSKRILYISHDNQLHGATRALIEIAEESKMNGDYPIVLFPTVGKADGLLNQSKIPSKVIFYPKFIEYGRESTILEHLRKTISLFYRLPRLILKIKKLEVDVIYINSVVNYGILMIGFFIKKPIVFHIREFGYEDHRVNYDFKGVLFNLLKKQVDLFLTNSSAVQGYYREKFNIESTLVYDGVVAKVDFDSRISAREALKVSKTRSTFYLGIVGNIIAGKGQVEVVKAVHKLLEQSYDCILYLIGDGDKRELEEYIHVNHLSENIIITGFCDQVDAYYKQLDVLIANSNMEAFGRVIIEASSFGIPVLARRTGASPEIIIEGETGYLHDGTIEDLIVKIKYVLDHPIESHQIGLKGWLRCKEVFNLDRSIAEIDAQFNRVVLK